MEKICSTCKHYDIPLYGGPCENCAKDGYRANYEAKEETVISHPEHYQSHSGLEVIDVIRAFTDELIGIEAVYTGNVIKYICRWKKKNGVEDLKKARQYLDWLIEMETHPHRSGSKPFSEMIEEDAKREKKPSEEATRIKMEAIIADLKDLWESLPESEKEEKKELPKNGRYSMNEEDCSIPWNLKPHMTPPYTYPVSGAYGCCESKIRENNDPEANRPKDIIEIIWTEFCRVFFEALKEVSEEDKEAQSVIDRLNQSQTKQNESLIQETILKEKENKKDDE